MLPLKRSWIEEKDKHWERKTIIATTSRVIDFLYQKLDSRDTIIFQTIMHERRRQILRTQVVKYSYWQRYKLNTPLSNERTTLQPLLQINLPKSGKAIVG